MSGWRVVLVKQSKAETQVPTNLKRLTEQRRRWNNSTLENSIVVLRIQKLWRRAPVYMVYKRIISELFEFSSLRQRC